ncbi:MAG: ATP-binding protein [Chitinophagaceae bacterium]
MKRVVKPAGYTMPTKQRIMIHGKTFAVGNLESYIKRNEVNEFSVKEKNGHAVMTTIPDMIIRADNEGKILDIEMDDQKSGITVDRKRLIGESLDVLFPAEIAVLHTQNLARILRSKKTVVYTYELKAEGGQSTHYEVRTVRVNENEILFILRDITTNKKERLSLVRGIIEGEEKERKRVAQELHDGLGQIISALYMQVGTLSKKPGLGEYLQGPMKMIADIISEYRAISHNLMPPILEDFSLPDILKALCKRVTATGQCEAIFRTTKFKSRPPKSVIREIYRISQELINNAIKHSDGDTIEVELIESPKDICIIISDNGKGFDIDEVKKKTDGIGLKNIYTRAELIGGTVEFESGAGKGTTVSVTIPRAKK